MGKMTFYSESWWEFGVIDLMAIQINFTRYLSGDNIRAHLTVAIFWAVCSRVLDRRLLNRSTIYDAYFLLVNCLTYRCVLVLYF